MVEGRIWVAFDRAFYHSRRTPGSKKFKCEDKHLASLILLNNMQSVFFAISLATAPPFGMRGFFLCLGFGAWRSASERIVPLLELHPERRTLQFEGLAEGAF
jgi:hypothetical protein